MTVYDFNNKYEKYLEDGHSGLTIIKPEVIEYLDKEFSRIIENNPDFKYAQIEITFNYICFYSNLEPEENQRIEKEIQKLINTKDEE